MKKQDLKNLYWLADDHYTLFIQGVRSSLALALVNYTEYKKQGGKRIHKQIQQIIEELNQ
jgi:hypothetical protein